jgi:hypothetical protein
MKHAKEAFNGLTLWYVPGEGLRGAEERPNTNARPVDIDAAIAEAKRRLAALERKKNNKASSRAAKAADHVERSPEAPPERPRIVRRLNQKEARSRIRTGCPVCGHPLKKRHIHRTDPETGEQRYNGWFYGCTNFGARIDACDGNYSLSPKGVERFNG